ncbi:hypothetical protein [Cellulomonas marina]|uniref:Uncharacterized protein n=1 Tax=Cellulomonas marina TaxID=988821 RepID=A0A1I0XI28_9CELL|nr:hypothetical protein [Cellulomonas marina]GIG29851.1 hypothetical protein Cma02nite_24510 [Cellulomonas marina]SFA99888.1 hypothetical protein SAMN05421867_10528 [Cellulomonas marina]
MSDDVVRSFLEASPPGWVTAELEYLRLGKTAELRANLTCPDGEVLRVATPRATSAAFRALRGAVARPGEGTWFTAGCRIDGDGRASFRFDDDGEPAFASEVSVDDALEEMAAHPRDAARTAPRLAARLAAARERDGAPGLQS